MRPPRSVGILTFHQADNYGEVLQAYGLSQAIRDLGHSAEILDYRPAAARKHYNRFGLRSGKSLQILLRRWRFYRFRKKLLPLSRLRYNMAEEFVTHPLNVDCLISGSDQVWNVQSFRGFDPIFFLDVELPQGGTKASYAATFGEASDFGTNRERIAELLERFDFLSVRDTNSQAIVQSLTGREAARVLDPSFLADFGPITPPRLHREPYIVVYFMERTPGLAEVVAALRDKLRLPVVAIGTAIKGDRSCLSAGPLEWLSLMKNADFVLTNSFHGLCFSIINRKDFLVLPQTKGQGRLDDLLAWMGLEKQVVRDQQALESISPDELKIDYSPVEQRLESALSESYAFLKEVLRG